MSRRVERERRPVERWGGFDTLEVAWFYEGEMGLRLHGCHDPANPYADHADCPSMIMDRWFAARKGWTLLRFAIGLRRHDRHSIDVRAPEVGA